MSDPLQELSVSAVAPSRRPPVPALCLGAATLMLAALSAGARAQASFDIVGLRPGMTEAEALAALNAHRGGMQVHKRNMSFSYSDGAQQHNTPPFLFELLAVANDAGGNEDFRLYFAPPPSEPRLVGLLRQVKLQAPPTQAQLSEQLSRKYGPPTVTGKNYSTLQLVWGEAGKPMCWRQTPKTTVIGVGDGGEILPNLVQGQAKGWAPKDLSQCGLAASATLAGEPVHNLTVRVSDYGAWAESQLKARQWVEGLKQDAIKARLAKGSGPKL